MGLGFTEISAKIGVLSSFRASLFKNAPAEICSDRGPICTLSDVGDHSSLERVRPY